MRIDSIVEENCTRGLLPFLVHFERDVKLSLSMKLSVNLCAPVDESEDFLR